MTVEVGVFVVTGGGSGIGKALALALAGRGQAVLIVGRNMSSLKAVSRASDLIECLVADVSTAAGRQLIVDTLLPFATLAGLIHNAGIIDPIVPLSQMDEVAWRKLMATNVDAPLLLSQCLLKKMPEGRVLHIGSGAAYFPMVGCAAYCVSKAALSMLTRCWQAECNAPAFASVMPGIIDTEMTMAIREAEHMGADHRHFHQQLKQNAQLLTPETVALFLCWLLLDSSLSEYSLKEWDIYDKTHHAYWLPPTHGVPEWDLAQPSKGNS